MSLEEEAGGVTGLGLLQQALSQSRSATAGSDASCNRLLKPRNWL